MSFSVANSWPKLRCDQPARLRRRLPDRGRSLSRTIRDDRERRPTTAPAESMRDAHRHPWPSPMLSWQGDDREVDRPAAGRRRGSRRPSRARRPGRARPRWRCRPGSRSRRPARHPAMMLLRSRRRTRRAASGRPSRRTAARRRTSRPRRSRPCARFLRAERSTNAPTMGSTKALADRGEAGQVERQRAGGEVQPEHVHGLVARVGRRRRRSRRPPSRRRWSCTARTARSAIVVYVGASWPSRTSSRPAAA